MATTQGGQLAYHSQARDGQAAPFPVVVVTIIILNLAIFILQTLSGGSTNSLNLIRFGAQHGPSIENGEYWRFVTAAFLHIGIFHLLFNCIGLFILGNLLEHLYGSTHFAFLYLASGVGGTLTSFFLNEFVSPQVISAGASGAIFGVAAAMVVAGLRYSDQIPENLQATFGTGALPFLGYNLYYGLTRSGIDNYAHIGGALTGALVGLILHPHAVSRRQARISAAGLAALVLVSFGLQRRAVTRFEANLRQAEVLFQEGNLSAAQAAIADLRKPGTDDPRVLTLASVLALRQGKLEEALRDLQIAEKVGPRYAPARVVRGELMMLMRRYPAAAAYFRQAVQIDPSNSAGHAGLGGALLEMDQPGPAASAFQEALRRSPNLAAAHYGLGLALERQGELSKAEESLQRAVNLDPRSVASRHALARVLLAEGKQADAVAELRKILEMEPADELALRTLTNLERQKGR